jgi:hypothetical protein
MEIQPDSVIRAGPPLNNGSPPMVFSFEKHDDPQVSTEDETNVSREEEVNKNGEMAEDASVRVAETDRVDKPMEGTEERMAELPFGPTILGYDITTPFSELGITTKGTGKRMAEQRQAPAVPPGLGITIGAAAARGPPVIALQEPTPDGLVALPDENLHEGQREAWRQGLKAERARVVAEYDEKVACIDKKLAELGGQS